jgi:hypothetical protein
MDFKMRANTEKMRANMAKMRSDMTMPFSSNL